MTEKVNKTPTHVVLVDDDPIFTSLVQKVARQERIQITIFSTVESAYRELPRLKFDVALFDYYIGDSTGMQLSQFIQQTGKKIPIILISYFGEIEKRQFPSFIDKAINKSAGPYSILTAVRKVLTQSGSSR